MNRNYSDAHDPDMTTAEYHGWPTRAEANADAADNWAIEPIVCDCDICLTCVIRRT